MLVGVDDVSGFLLSFWSALVSVLISSDVGGVGGFLFFIGGFLLLLLVANFCAVGAGVDVGGCEGVDGCCFLFFVPLVVVLMLAGVDSILVI